MEPQRAEGKIVTEIIQALVGCQNDDCAAEVSYPLDMVHLFHGKPVCENCFDGGQWEGLTEDQQWSDLPPVTLDHLCA